MSYHTISHHIISYHIISYHIISYHIISYHIIPHVSYHIYHLICIISYRINHIISIIYMAYYIIYHISYIISIITYHIMPYHIIYHIPSYHIIYHVSCNMSYYIIYLSCSALYITLYRPLISDITLYRMTLYSLIYGQINLIISIISCDSILTIVLYVGFPVHIFFIIRSFHRKGNCMLPVSTRSLKSVSNLFLSMENHCRDLVSKSPRFQ